MSTKTVSGSVERTIGERQAGFRPSDGTRPHADRPIATILLARDGTPIHSEPEGVVFPAAALSALQAASLEVSGSPHFTVMFPTQRLDAWRLSNGTLLVNLVRRRPGDAERAALQGAVVDGQRLAQPQARPQQAEAAIPEKEDKPEFVPPEPDIAPAARPPIIEPEPEGQPEPAEPESEQQHPPRKAGHWPGRRLVIARAFNLALLLVALTVVLTALGLTLPTFGSSGRSSTRAHAPIRNPMPPAVRLAYSGDLHYRSSGPGIARLQARLRQLHYYNYPDLTGYFGDATFGAVWTFQQERHIPASGIADKRTIDALNACDASCTY